MVKTRMWRDTWVRTLDREGKLLWCYILTNEHTHICGFYELPEEDILLHTGLTENQLESSWKQLTGKAFYINGWVCIKNYAKHQNVAKNARVQKSIEQALENDVPDAVLEKANQLFLNNNNTNIKSEGEREPMDRVSIGYPSTSQQKGKKEISTEKEKDVDKSSLKWLEDIPQEDIDDLIEKYWWSASVIKDKAEDLALYCRSKGKKYKDYRALLINALKKDYPKEKATAAGKYDGV